MAATKAQRIMLNSRRAKLLRMLAMRSHLRAAALARMALVAKHNRRHVIAANLLRRALRMKAAAVRAGVRAMVHRQRAMALRRA
jgi:hypothetical protein